jgi:hypothetical protein
LHLSLETKRGSDAKINRELMSILSIIKNLKIHSLINHCMFFGKIMILFITWRNVKSVPFYGVCLHTLLWRYL